MTKTLPIKAPTLRSTVQSVTRHTWHLFSDTPGSPKGSFISSLDKSRLSELTVTYESGGTLSFSLAIFQLGKFPRGSFAVSQSL